MRQRQTVRAVGAARLGLLALTLVRLLRGRLDDPDAQSHAACLDDCAVEITTGGMLSTLHFAADGVTVTCEPALRPTVRIRASLHALVEAAHGRSLLVSVLTGRLRVLGRLSAIWHLLRLFAAPRLPPARSTNPTAAALLERWGS